MSSGKDETNTRVIDCSEPTLHNFPDMELDTKCLDCGMSIRRSYEDAFIAYEIVKYSEESNG